MRFLLVMFAALLATPALAQSSATAAPTFDFTKPADFVRALQKAGYRAEIKKLDSGRPYVASAANGNDFSIYFYECDALNMACKSFEFYSWWKKQPYFTPVLANTWNAEKRFLKVAIDEDGDLAQRLYGTGVGMTEPNFLELLDWYQAMSSTLGEFLDEAAPPAPKKNEPNTK